MNDIYFKLRQRIADFCAQHAPAMGEVEVDESYFGPKRIRGLPVRVRTQTGKRGRGAGQKILVFGLLRRNGQVFTELVAAARKATLQAVIRGHVDINSVIHSDGWRGYNGLVDVGYAKHFRVQHGANEFANAGSHSNGIESFWAYLPVRVRTQTGAKLRLSARRGIRKAMFYYHLKETEFRFNHRRDNLYHVILKRHQKKPI